MTSVYERIVSVLDWAIDDRWANHNTVFENGLDVRGEWHTGRLFVHGEELEPEGWSERSKPWGQLRNPTRKYRWGEDATEDHRIATAILRWFLDEAEVASIREDFATEVVARFPPRDFELTFNYVGWRNGNAALWRWE